MERNFDLDAASWATLRALLQTGMELVPAERDRWLDELDEEFESFRPRLRALLAHAGKEDDGGAWLESLPDLGTAAALHRPSAQQPNELIGPYRLIRQLGAGGMGTVWLAERIDVLTGRQVALKLPHGAMLDPKQRAGLAERLVRERDILARLAHPNIARLYDAGIGADGQPYLALEYVEGMRIDSYCAQHSLGLRARLALLQQVARAVAHAHANLVVHRDLKPSNILVTPAGEVRLLDFGIAKILVDGSSAETALTREAGRALTLDYAAPEQIAGGAVSTATDVYALAVVAYELLSGERPYRPKRSTAAALEDAIAAGNVAPPSQRTSDAKLRKLLRGDLDTVVLKALRKEPDERYQTINEFADEIERYLHNRPVLAQPDSAWYRGRKFVARNALATGASTAVLIAIIAGAGVALWQTQVAIGQQHRAEQVKQFIESIFTDADPFASGPDAVTVRGLLQRADARVVTSFNDRPDVRMELASLLAQGMIGIGDFDGAELVLGRAIEDGRRTLGEHDPQTLLARVQMTSVLRFSGRLDQMARELTVLIPLLEADPHSAPQGVALAYENLAHLAIDQRRYADARAAAERLSLYTETVFGEHHPASITALLLLALTDQYSGMHARALGESERALQAAIALYGDRHPRTWDARGVMARGLGNVGDFGKAAAELKQIVSQAQEALGVDAPMVGYYAADVARYQYDADQLVESLKFAQLSLAVLSQSADGNSYTLAAAKRNLGRALLGVGRLSEAALPLAESLAAFRGVQGDDSTVAGDVAAHLALLTALSGDHASAATQLAAATPSLQSAEPVFRFRALHFAGILARWRGDLDAARDLQQRAIAQVDDESSAFAHLRAAARGELMHAAVEQDDAEGSLRTWDQLQISATAPPQSVRVAELLVSYARAHLLLGHPHEAEGALRAARQFWQSQPNADPRWAKEVSRWLSLTRLGRGSV